MTTPKVTFRCTRCGKSIRAREELAGKRSKCPSCQEPITIPKANNQLSQTAVLSPTPEEEPLPTTKSESEPSTPPETGTNQPDELTELPGCELIKELGRGGMGVVYQARQINLDRLVAVKTIHLNLGKTDKGRALARFEQEARSVAKLRHPNIVTAFDFGNHEGQVYFVMEFLEGENLEERLERTGAMDEMLTLNIIRQAAAGLAHASQVGLIHRDIKPANLFLVPPPEGTTLPKEVPLVKVTDFGLAWLDNNPEAERITNAGSVIGTPIYMAPEQFKGVPVDQRADIYALGITAMQMLMGTPPYMDKTLWEIMTEKVSGHIPKIPNKVSRPTLSLLTDMLASDPAKRLNDYATVIEQIDTLLRTESAALTGEIKPSPFDSQATEKLSERPKKSPTPFVWLGLGIVLLISAAVAGFVFFGMLPTRDNSVKDVPKPFMKTVGQPSALFDGKSIVAWDVVSGLWIKDTDEEGGAVLAGSGVIRRALSVPTHYRLSMGADVRKAKYVELHFAIPADANKPRYVLRMSPDKAVLGSQMGLKGKFTALVEGTELQPPTPGSSPYQELRVERHGADWFAYAQGKLIGTAPVLGKERPEFFLRTETGGTVYFDSIIVVPLGT